MTASSCHLFAYNDRAVEAHVVCAPPPSIYDGCIDHSVIPPDFGFETIVVPQLQHKNDYTYIPVTFEYRIEYSLMNT